MLQEKATGLSDGGGLQLEDLCPYSLMLDPANAGEQVIY